MIYDEVPYIIAKNIGKKKINILALYNIDVTIQTFMIKIRNTKYA